MTPSARRLFGILIASLTILAAGCGGGSDGDTLSSYLARVAPEQTAYRHAQRGALQAMDILGKPVTTRGDCATAARMVRSARDAYGRLGDRMALIEAPAALRVAHGELATSLRVYAQFFDELQLAIDRCNAAALMVEDASPLPDRAQRLRSAWRIAVRSAADHLGVAVPGWALEVGRPPPPPADA